MDRPNLATIHRFLPLGIVLTLLLGVAGSPAFAAAPGSSLPDLRLPATALINQCSAAIPRAQPHRAHQVRNAMFGLRISMSYRVAAHRLSPGELRAAAAKERACYDFLAETCRPLLS